MKDIKLTFTYPINEYANKVKEYYELDKISFDKNSSKNDILNKLKKVASEKQKIYTVLNTMNYEYCGRFEDDPNLLNDEYANIILSLVNSLFENGVMHGLDNGFSYRASKLLLNYYNNSDELDKYTRLLFNCTVLRILIYSFHYCGRKYGSPFSKLCLDLMDKYDKLSDVSKSTALRALSMTVVTEAQFEYDNWWKIDDILTSICKKNSNNNNYDDEMLFTFYHNIAGEYCDDCLDARAKGMKEIDSTKFHDRLVKTLKILGDHLNNQADLGNTDDTTLAIAYTRLCFHLGLITIEDALSKFTELMINAEKTIDEVMQMSSLAQTTCFYLVYLKVYSGYSESKIDQLSKERVHEVLPKILKIKKASNDITFNYHLFTFLNGAGLTCDFNEFAELILETTVYSDKALFIHTEMVKNISLVLFDYLIDKSPELFTNVCDFNLDYIKLHKDELRSILSDCCMFHDIGKFFMLDIVENAMRKLTDDEFDIIKVHPVDFDSIYPARDNLDARVSCIRDCALSHHIWYNGENGYPKEKHTKNQILVDILSVADSMDAATDPYGRPYRMSKDLDTLIKEFKDGENTKYSPYVIKAFENKIVIDKLRFLITEGRDDLYYQIYTFNKLK